MGGEPLPMLPAEPVTGTKMENLAEHLVLNADDPADVTFEFAPGKFVRLDTPANLEPGDERSPLLVGHLIVGGALAALFVGAVVQPRKPPGLWHVFTIAALTAGVISTNCSAPIRGKSKITDTTTQFQQVLQVLSPHVPIVSPRTWGEPAGRTTGRGQQAGRTRRTPRPRIMRPRRRSRARNRLPQPDDTDRVRPAATRR